MENAEQGELSHYIESRTKLDENESCKFFQQLISGIKYLHESGCAHRDVKPSNILVDASTSLKLIDFGLGNLYKQDEKLKTACGSPCYAAPEIIAGDVYDPVPVDIWSSGITLYAMLCGSLPFDEESKSLLYKKILACDYMIPSYVSSEATDLIKKILVIDPKQRYTINQIITHPFFMSFKPNQMHSGINVASKQLPVFYPIAYLTGDKMKVPCRAIVKMIMENEHNKYTTSYYLFKQKYDNGHLNLGKYETMTQLEDSNIELVKSRRNLRDDNNPDSRISKELKRKYHGSNRIDVSKSKSKSVSLEKSKKRRIRDKKLENDGFLISQDYSNKEILPGKPKKQDNLAKVTKENQLKIVISNLSNKSLTFANQQKNSQQSNKISSNNLEKNQDGLEINKNTGSQKLKRPPSSKSKIAKPLHPPRQHQLSPEIDKKIDDLVNTSLSKKSYISSGFRKLKSNPKKLASSLRANLEPKRHKNNLNKASYKTESRNSSKNSYSVNKSVNSWRRDLNISVSQEGRNNHTNFLNNLQGLKNGFITSVNNPQTNKSVGTKKMYSQTPTYQRFSANSKPNSTKASDMLTHMLTHLSKENPLLSKKDFIRPRTSTNSKMVKTDLKNPMNNEITNRLKTSLNKLFQNPLYRTNTHSKISNQGINVQLHAVAQEFSNLRNSYSRDNSRLKMTPVAQYSGQETPKYRDTSAGGMRTSKQSRKKAFINQPNEINVKLNQSMKLKNVKIEKGKIAIPLKHNFNPE